jgi:small subunit ribosomal protein S8
MSMTDPVSDMLTRIRNAIQRKYDVVDVPSSRLKLELARILTEEGFIRRHESIARNKHKTIRLYLKYAERDQSVIKGLRKISKPSRRVYTGKDEIPTVRGGLGLAVLSTSQGVITDRESKKRHIGGEVLCYIW